MILVTTPSNMISNTWWHQANHSISWFIFNSRRTPSPFSKPVFAAVVSKHIHLMCIVRLCYLMHIKCCLKVCAWVHFWDTPSPKNMMFHSSVSKWAALPFHQRSVVVDDLLFLVLLCPPIFSIPTNCQWHLWLKLFFEVQGPDFSHIDSVFF